MSNPLLKLIDISKYYSSKDAVTLGLRKVNVELRKGEFIAVTGESGSGKSTLLNVLSGIDSYEDGEMLLDGQETSCFTNSEWDDYRRKNIAFIFQDYSLIDSYTVFQNVELSLFDNYPEKKARKARVLELLDKVGLLSHRRHKCTRLSGGQKQRVAIARALAKDAPIILADEPTGNLDSVTSESIIKLIAETSKDKLLVMVTHNYEDVAKYATRKLRMYDGSIAEDKVIQAPPENVGGSELKAISEDDEKKRFKGSVRIAMNNLIATPKRSLFILSTSFIATLLIAVFLFGYINVIVPPQGMNLMGDRKDTIYVIDKDRQELDIDTVNTIKNVSGVEAVLTSYDAYNLNFVPKTMIWDDVHYVENLRMSILTDANYGNKTPAYGKKPQNDNEILLGWSNQGKPDLSLIGKEVELILLSSSDYYYEGMFDYEYHSIDNFVIRTYKVSGYDVNGYCYITANEMETLSQIYSANKKPNINMELNGYKDSTNTEHSIYDYIWTNSTNVKNSDTIPSNIIYYVYNNDMDNFDTTNLATYFKSYGAVEVNATIYKYDSNYQQSSFNYTILPATPTINNHIYEAYVGIDNKPVFVFRKSNNPYHSESSKTTALVIMAQDKKAEAIINSLTVEGFKVIYPYSRPQGVEEIIIKIVRQIFGLLVGLIIVAIAVALISEVYSKVSKAKKKDFNILRTVGLSTTIIKIINYAEFLIINVTAFSFTFLTFLITVILGRVLGNSTLTNAINSLLPYGALHFQSLLVYAGVFALLMMLTLLIAKKFNKKMFSTSVKKSLTETA